MALDATSDNMHLRVLIVDDEPTFLESCSSVLTNDGFEVTCASRGEEARALLERRVFDIALIDLNLPQISGLDLLKIGLKVRPKLMVIMMTGRPDVESSIEALRMGAWDYLPKPFTASHLKILFGRARYALSTGREQRPAEPVGSAGRAPAKPFLLLGESPEFLRTIKLARRVAKTDASVFITGESGSGKEMIAQFIHQQSRRRDNPLMAVNCAALPESLLESELFGHVKGAFTGAIRDKPGLLEIANGGTFFLDELTEMPLPIQAKLLRVIQDGVVRRVGSETVDARVNVRFISATNFDGNAADQQVLRQDLYYRLSVVPIAMPPLRRRREDIPLLAEHFLSVYWARHREEGAPMPTFSQAAIEALQHRPWKGNVRELQNVIEHAVVLLDPGTIIQPDDIPYLENPLDGEQRSARSAPLNAAGQLEEEYHLARERVLTEFEWNYVNSVMREAGSNMTKAAKIAGVDRTTLYRLMEKHGLTRVPAHSRQS